MNGPSTPSENWDVRSLGRRCQRPSNRGPTHKGFDFREFDTAVQGSFTTVGSRSLADARLPWWANSQVFMTYQKSAAFESRSVTHSISQRRRPVLQDGSPLDPVAAMSSCGSWRSVSRPTSDMSDSVADRHDAATNPMASPARRLSRNLSSAGSTRAFASQPTTPRSPTIAIAAVGFLCVSPPDRHGGPYGDTERDDEERCADQADSQPEIEQEIVGSGHAGPRRCSPS